MRKSRGTRFRFVRAPTWDSAKTAIQPTPMAKIKNGTFSHKTLERSF